MKVISLLALATLAASCFPSARRSGPPNRPMSPEQLRAAGEQARRREIAQAKALGVKNETPPARDATGRPVFDPQKVRHRAGTPYFCFSLVTRGGDEVSQCKVAKSWCASTLRKAKRDGLAITGGCSAAESVWCYVAYTSGAALNTARSFCWGTRAHCQTMNAQSVRHAGTRNVSACKQLDRDFAPPARSQPGAS